MNFQCFIVYLFATQERLNILNLSEAGRCVQVVICCNLSPIYFIVKISELLIIVPSIAIAFPLFARTNILNIISYYSMSAQYFVLYFADLVETKFQRLRISIFEFFWRSSSKNCNPRCSLANCWLLSRVGSSACLFQYCLPWITYLPKSAGPFEWIKVYITASSHP